MSWTEWKDTAGGQMDYTRKGRIQRVFKVYGGASAAQILAAPETVDNGQGTFLPAYNTPHPDYPNTGILLDTYECSTQDGVLITVTALYSNDRRFKFPNKIDVLEPTFKSKGASYEARTLEIPYGVAKAFDNANGDVTEVWKLRTKPVIHRFMRFTYRCNVQNYDGNAQEAIRARIGDIHYFGFDGAPLRHYQFSGCDATQQDHVDGWTLEYEWTRDPGTPFFKIDGMDPTKLALPPSRGEQGAIWFENEQWARPPFVELGFYVTSLETVIFPIVTPHAFDDLGWKSLPGVT